MRYVRATGTYGINDFNRADDDCTFRTYPGQIVPDDHWAVVAAFRGHVPGERFMFEPVSDDEAAALNAAAGVIDGRSAELDTMRARFGEDRSAWPAGQLQRAENLERGIQRDASERAQRAEVERRRSGVLRAAGYGHSEAGDGNLTPDGRTPELMRRVDPWDGDPRRMDRRQAVDRARKVLEVRDNTLHLQPEQLERVEGLLRAQNKSQNGGWLAQWTLLTENEHYRSAFQEYMTHYPPAFSPEQARALHTAREFRAMSGSVDTAGGFGVPVLIDVSIIMTAQGSLNPFRQISRQVTITTDEWKGVSSAGVTWSYDAEGSTVSDDSPTLAQPNVPMVTARGWIPFSIEVGMDYPGFANEMVMLLGEGLDELQAQSFATGSGSGQPRGIITALDANTNSEVVVTSDGVFQGADINKVWGALPDRWKANATWVMSHDAGNEVATFGNGNNLSFFTVDLTDVVETIRTRPVKYSSYFPDFTGTTGAANILVVGDFRNFLIVDRAGMQVEFVPHLFDTTSNRPTGQRGFFAWARHGSNSVADQAFRLLQNT